MLVDDIGLLMLFFLFAVMILVNSVADNEKVILYYRYEFAGLPINMLDFGLGLMFLTALATISRPRFQTAGTHRLLYWTIGILIGSVLFGLLGAVASGIETRFWATIARNVMTLPLCIFLGYQLIRTPRHATWAAYVWVLASVASGLIALLFVRGTAESLNSFDRLRETGHGGDIGLSAMAFLAFCVVAGVRFLPLWMSLALVPFAAICYFSLPHRSGWVTGAATLLFALLVLPRARFGRKLVLSGVLLTGLALTMVVAVGAYSKLTGRDFGEYVGKRLMSLLPGDQDGVRSKAWDSRLPAIQRELEIWMQNPLMGKGFGIQFEEERTGLSSGRGGFRHNVWSASLAESGPLGLAGYMLPPISAMWVGFLLVRRATDKGTMYVGALAAVVGCATFMLSFMTLSINTQRQAIPLGLICGMVYRCRSIQQALESQGAGYYETGEDSAPLMGEAEYELSPR